MHKGERAFTVLALWCVYQSACKVASYLLGAIVSVLKGLGTRVGAHGARPGVCGQITDEGHFFREISLSVV